MSEVCVPVTEAGRGNREGPLFRGVGVALVTSFDEHGELGAVRGALPPASGFPVIHGELGAVRGALPPASGFPVIAGTGAPSIREVVALTAAARDGGADAVLALSPPQVSDPRPYYEAVAEAAGGVPVLAHHYPDFSPPGIALEHLSELPVSGCKDSTGDATRFHQEFVAARFATSTTTRVGRNGS
ncbi:MAG: dihydrodipicolinate synthase family protein [Acidimicrobiales bacterium]